MSNKDLSDVFVNYVTQTYTYSPGQEHVEEVEEQIQEIPSTFLPEDTLTAIDMMNAERDALFGATAVAEESEPLQLQLDEATLANYAQKHGIGQLIVLFQDTMKVLGYEPMSVAQFVHNKSGVIVQV